MEDRKMVEVRVEPREIVVGEVRQLLDALRQEGVSISAAYLYGSHSRGTADSDSDIDVAVVSPDLSGNRLEDWCRLNEIASRIDVRLEVIGFRPEHFRDENPLAWEVKTAGVQLM